MAHNFSRATVCNASRILAVVEASVLLCVCLSVALCVCPLYVLCDCIKMVQARITKSSLSAATNLTRVSGSQKQCEIGQGYY